MHPLMWVFILMAVTLLAFLVVDIHDHREPEVKKPVEEEPKRKFQIYTLEQKRA